MVSVLCWDSSLRSVFFFGGEENSFWCPPFKMVSTSLKCCPAFCFFFVFLFFHFENKSQKTKGFFIIMASEQDFATSLAGGNDSEKLHTLCSLPYKHQSVWYLNAFWKEGAEQEVLLFSFIFLFILLLLLFPIGFCFLFFLLFFSDVPPKKTG